MRHSRLFALLSATLLATPAIATPQDTGVDPRCAMVRPAFPAGFAGWSTRTPLTAGIAARNAPVLPIGRGADLTLAAGARFVPLLAPGKAADAASAGGLVMFQVPRAGTYRVALDSPAWVDVIRSGRMVAASAHGHGPMCTGIRKIVDFRLRPGRYVLQLSGSATPTLALLIARAA